MKKYRKSLEYMEQYRPGTDVGTVSEKYGIRAANIMKLSSNENPLGTSPEVYRAVSSSLKDIHMYPETTSGNLRAALAEKYMLSESNFFVGAGSDQVLDIFLQSVLEKGDKVVTEFPSFPQYSLISTKLGANVDSISLRNDFSFSVDAILSAIQKETAAVILCNPNNPTGTIIAKDDILRIVKESKTYVVVDEAYIEFGGESSLDLISRNPNLLILRSFSKSYGLAAMRIGYGISSNEELFSNMMKVKLPFNILQISEVAAIAALSDERFLKQTKITVEREKKKIIVALEKNGFKVFPSYANFVWVDCSPTRHTSEDLYNKLLEMGVIMRPFGKIKGFQGDYFRMSIPAKKKANKLVKILHSLE